MIVEFLKTAKQRAKSNKKDVSLYQNGFYSLGGLISGFLMVILWDHCNIPHFNDNLQHSLVTHEEIKNAKGITTDKTIATMIATALMMSELVGVKGGMSSGSGFLLGYTMASALKTNKYLGQV